MSDTSQDIEHDAEASRRRLSGILEELRVRVSPGETVERLVRDARQDGTGVEFMRMLKQQVRTNPVACMLIAAGISWLMLSDLQKARGTAPADDARGATRRTRGQRPPVKKARPRTGKQAKKPASRKRA